MNNYINKKNFIDQMKKDAIEKTFYSISIDKCESKKIKNDVNKKNVNEKIRKINDNYLIFINPGLTIVILDFKSNAENNILKNSKLTENIVEVPLFMKKCFKYNFLYNIFFGNRFNHLYNELTIFYLDKFMKLRKQQQKLQNIFNKYNCKVEEIFTKETQMNKENEESFIKKLNTKINLADILNKVEERVENRYKNKLSSIKAKYKDDLWNMETAYRNNVKNLELECQNFFCRGRKQYDIYLKNIEQNNRTSVCDVRSIFEVDMNEIKKKGKMEFLDRQLKYRKDFLNIKFENFMEFLNLANTYWDDLLEIKKKYFKDCVQRIDKNSIDIYRIYDENVEYFLKFNDEYQKGRKKMKKNYMDQIYKIDIKYINCLESRRRKYKTELWLIKVSNRDAMWYLETKNINDPLYDEAINRNNFFFSQLRDQGDFWYYKTKRGLYKFYKKIRTLIFKQLSDLDDDAHHWYKEAQNFFIFPWLEGMREVEKNFKWFYNKISKNDLFLELEFYLITIKNDALITGINETFYKFLIRMVKTLFINDD